MHDARNTQFDDLPFPVWVGAVPGAHNGWVAVAGDERRRAVVVGAGIGGLTAAIALRRTLAMRAVPAGASQRMVKRLTSWTPPSLT